MLNSGAVGTNRSCPLSESVAKALFGLGPPSFRTNRDQILLSHASKIVSPIARLCKSKNERLVCISASPVKIKTHSARLFFDE
jgi:hypothetical protein